MSTERFEFGPQFQALEPVDQLQHRITEFLALSVEGAPDGEEAGWGVEALGTEGDFTDFVASRDGAPLMTGFTLMTDDQDCSMFDVRITRHRFPPADVRRVLWRMSVNWVPPDDASPEDDLGWFRFHHPEVGFNPAQFPLVYIYSGSLPAIQAAIRDIAFHRRPLTSLTSLVEVWDLDPAAGRIGCGSFTWTYVQADGEQVTVGTDVINAE
jgi:hypothetical protein